MFCQHYDTDALDASVLLMPLVRFLPPDDERVRATVLAIADELTEDGLVLRYRVEETDDGLERRGGHVHDLLVLARVGAGGDRRARARPRRCARSCCRTPARCSSTPRRSTRAPAATSGNFPQAFTHLALINAVMHVIRAEAALTGAAERHPSRRSQPRGESLLAGAELISSRPQGRCRSAAAATFSLAS